MNANLTPSSDTVSSLAELQALYAAPGERALRKQLSALDEHAQRFIGLSPFLVLSSHDGAGGLDASPRGGVPGFVKLTEQGDLLIPDAAGNNRLDSLRNIVQTGAAGLLFLIPGVDETLRINGRAWLSRAAADIGLCSASVQAERRPPKLVIRVAVREVYLHCAKALMRSRLWSDEARQPRSVLPSMGQMIHDQARLAGPVESQAEMVARYAADL